MFFQYLQRLRESAKEDWAKEGFVGSDLQEWALKNAKALGMVQAISTLMEIESIEEMEGF